MVYLHGCPDSRLSRPPEAYAEIEGARVIAVDRPGYGASDPDPRGDEATQADDVVALLDAMGIDRACVLGWSSGAPGALAVAARHPHRVRAVGVAAGQVVRDVDALLGGLSPDDYADAVAPLLAPLDAPLSLHLEAVVEGKDAPYLADLASVPGLHEQLALGSLAAVERGVAGVERDLRAMTTPLPFALADVRAPVLLWYGTADARFTPVDGEWIASRLPDAHLDVVEGASHLLPLVHWRRLVTELITTEGDIDAPQP